MPFDKLFRKEYAEAVEQDDFYALSLREAIVEVNEELELYDSAAWAKVSEKLDELSQSAVRDIMNATDAETMLLARERARVVSQLRAEPDELRLKLAGLRKELQELEGEIDG